MGEWIKSKLLLRCIKEALRRSFLSLFSLSSLAIFLSWLTLEVVVVLLLFFVLEKTFLLSFEFVQMITISLLLFINIYLNLDPTGRERYKQLRRIGIIDNMEAFDKGVEEVLKQKKERVNIFTKSRDFLKRTRATQVVIILISLISLILTYTLY